MVSDRKLRIVPKIETFMNDSRYTHDEKLRLIDSGFCVLLEDYTLLNAWFQQQNRVLGTRGCQMRLYVQTDSRLLQVQIEIDNTGTGKQAVSPKM